MDEYSIWREYLQVLFLKYWGARRQARGLAFKGGTAIRLLLQGSRFSEDLDFSAALSAAEIGREIRETVAGMAVELPALQLDRPRSTPVSWLGRLILPLPQSRHPITVSLNCFLKERITVVKRSILETSFPVAPYPIVNHLPWPEIMAEKVRALSMRQRGRDVFDVWFLLTKDIPMDKALIAKKLKAMDKHWDEPQFLRVVNSVPLKTLKDDLDKFLPLLHRPLIPDLPRLLVERWRQIEKK